MIAFQFRDEDGWLEEIRRLLEEAGTPITDWSSGSGNRTFWQLVARLLSEDDYMSERLLDMFFVGPELKGDLLKKRAAEFRVYPKEGAKAKGKIILSRSTSAPFDIEVSAGRTFSTTDKTVTVQVLENVLIPTGSTESIASCVATDEGTRGNLAANTELIQSGVAIMGVELATVSAEGFSGGVDAESDDELRERLLEKMRNPEGSGTRKDYEQWAKEVPGVVTARCIPLARGNGTADIVITTDGGLPPEDLVQDCQVYINEKCIMNADILVRSPESVPVDIEIVYYAAGDMREEIAEAVQHYVWLVGVGGVLRYSRLIDAAVSVPGVDDVEVKNPISNLQLLANQMAVIGSLTITKGAA